MKFRHWMLIATLALSAAACGPKNNGENNGNNGTSNSDPNASTNNDPNVDPNVATNSDPNVDPNSSTNNNTTPTNNSTNNTTTPTNNSTNNATNNPTNNATNNATNNTTNNGTGGVTMEVEPNDDVATATAFTVGDTVTGTADDNNDDVFTVDLTGGTILEVEVVSTQRDAEFDIEIWDEGETIDARYMLGDAGAKRQFFVPMDGTYVLYLYDLTNEPNDYELATRELDPTATDVDLPVHENGDLNDFAVDIFSITASADEELGAETFAERSPVMGNLDSFLFVWSPNAGLVAANDDIDVDNFDSSVVFDATNGEEYWIVVDAYSIDTSDNGYELDVEATGN